MHSFRILAVAAILITSQAHALEPEHAELGCPPESGNCGNGGYGGGGGDGGGGTGGGGVWGDGIDFGPSHLLGTVSDGAGGTIDFFSDNAGEWWLITAANGDTQVGWSGKKGPKTHKAIPVTPGMKRPKYLLSELTPGPNMTLASAQAAAAAAAKPVLVKPNTGGPALNQQGIVSPAAASLGPAVRKKP